MTVTTYISEHPGVALIVGAAHLTMAEYIENAQIPLIVMQLFQIGARAIGVSTKQLYETLYSQAYADFATKNNISSEKV